MPIVLGRRAVTDTAPRPDLGAYLSTQYRSEEQVIKELASRLGMRLVAYIAGFASPDEVQAYWQGRSYRQDDVDARLRLALTVATFLGDVDPGNEAAWFQGRNPQLADSSPAWLLREGDVNDVRHSVLSAARAYSVGG